MSNRKSHYMIGLIICSILLASMSVAQNRKHFLDRKIKNQTTLTSHWIKINASPPLKPERDIQGIALRIEESYAGYLESDGHLLPDGSHITPEVQLVDTEGNTYNLVLDTQFGKELLLYSIPDDLKSKQFRSVRIRSDRPIRCKEIIWRCYFIKDVD